MPTITNAKNIQSKSRIHHVASLGGDSYSVTSGASGSEYHVTVYGCGATCSCEWSKYRPARDRRSGCSHVVSVYGFIEAERGRRVSVWSNREEAGRQHRPTLVIGDGVTLTSRAV